MFSCVKFRPAVGRRLWGETLPTLLNELPLKESSQVLKEGTKSKRIRLVGGDHEISARWDGYVLMRL